MDSLELRKYIKDAREFGLTEKEIIVDLTKAGWDICDIHPVLGIEQSAQFDLLVEERRKNDAENINLNVERINNTNINARLSKIPLIFVSIVGLFIIAGVMYSSNLFNLNIEKISYLATDANNAYNELLKQNKDSEILNKESTMIFVGDIMLSEYRGTGKEMKKNDNYKYPFFRIADILRKADITFGNLEGPLSSRGGDIGGKYSFRAKPKAVLGLAYAGFDVLSIANNHIFDWGEKAFLDTLSILNFAKISPVGGGIDLRNANKPVIKDVNGTNVAFLAFSAVDYDIGSFEAKSDKPGKTPFNIDTIVKNIRKIKMSGSVDIIVISLHWGYEYKTRSSEQQRLLAYTMVDAGADLIIGHHPHVVQEVEAYKNSWIAYSLGNFVFDQNFSKETMRGLMLEVKIKFGNIIKINPISINISDTFQPYVTSF